MLAKAKGCTKQMDGEAKANGIHKAAGRRSESKGMEEVMKGMEMTGMTTVMG